MSELMCPQSVNGWVDEGSQEVAKHTQLDWGSLGFPVSSFPERLGYL